MVKMFIFIGMLLKSVSLFASDSLVADEDDERHLLLSKISQIPMGQTDLEPAELYNINMPQESLNDDIAFYHSLPKTEIKFLGARIVLLYKICMDSYKISSLNPTCASNLDKLFIRAAGKYNYLKALSHTHSIFKTKNSFVSFIQNYIPFEQKSDLVSRHMPDFFLYRQALDPYQSNHPGLHKLYDEWLQLPTTDRSSLFFLWLEQYNRPDEPVNKFWVTPQIRDSLKVTFKDGAIYTNQEKLTTERADYILDSRYNFYISNTVKHLAFFTGKAVAAAGEVKVNEGKITYINDNTGHYQTRIPHTLQVLRFLKQYGVFSDDAIVGYLDIQTVMKGLRQNMTNISVKTFLENPPFEPKGLTVGFDYQKSKMFIKKIMPEIESEPKKRIVKKL